MRAAVAAAAAANVLIICSAGNMAADIDRRPLFPVSIPADNLVGVAATAPADAGAAITQFSNFGPLTVPVAAPGEGVVSTAPTAATRRARARRWPPRTWPAWRR